MGQLRGRIYQDEGRRKPKEGTRYWGNHFVECYVIRGGVCVAADRIEVPIGPKELPPRRSPLGLPLNVLSSPFLSISGQTARVPREPGTPSG